ncbi:hypothetical protein [Alteraurantiacibacter buctensis]|uniref:Uncharacterized protein n=1 Tax=Alteraurantiacibacter buctensis TaxID=1503981 RepID=A0A844YW25_9SPHN|nr:hypothetical protein [Alteraurantiacibacter buctensis]MXO71739.1 hypothetical protein [Alteraurantiacibacter buctensis]
MTYHLESWEQRRQAALQILANGRLSRAAGSFMGQCVADASPLSDKQIDWFLTLAERAGVAVEAEQ